MAERYVVDLTPAARKQLLKLDRQARKLIIGVLEMLAQTPRPPAVKSLTGRPGQLRVRVRDYRIIYLVDDGGLVVLVVKFGHSREVYR